MFHEGGPWFHTAQPQLRLHEGGGVEADNIKAFQPMSWKVVTDSGPGIAQQRGTAPLGPRCKLGLPSPSQSPWSGTLESGDTTQEEGKAPALIFSHPSPKSSTSISPFYKGKLCPLGVNAHHHSSAFFPEPPWETHILAQTPKVNSQAHGCSFACIRIIS